MRAPAQVDQGTAPVHGTPLARHQLINVVQLIFAVREHLPEVFFTDLQSIEALLFLEDSLRFLLKRRPVGLNDNAASFVSYCNL